MKAISPAVNAPSTAISCVDQLSRILIRVSLRMLRALTDIATTIADPAYHQTLVEQGQRIVAGCAEHLRAEELGEMRIRLSTLEKLTMPPQEEAHAAVSPRGKGMHVLPE